MRISDWMSDVCSSDLSEKAGAGSMRWTLSFFTHFKEHDYVGIKRKPNRHPSNLHYGAQCSASYGPHTLRHGHGALYHASLRASRLGLRSEERRVGKARVSTGRTRW